MKNPHVAWITFLFIAATVLGALSIAALENGQYIIGSVELIGALAALGWMIGMMRELRDHYKDDE